jgi:hypothetical protein
MRNVINVGNVGNVINECENGIISSLATFIPHIPHIHHIYHINKPGLAAGFIVPRTRFELAHPFGLYHLKVARLPVSPPGQRATKLGNFGKLFFHFITIFY